MSLSIETATQMEKLSAQMELTVSQVVDRALKIREAMERAMDPGVHYGRIPGTPKPTLLQPGAQKLVVLFQFDPQYESIKRYEAGNHLTVESKCVLYSIPTGQRLGSGEGLCTTREKKYAYRWEGHGSARRRMPNPYLEDEWNTVVKMANKRAQIAAVLNVTATSDVFTQDLEDRDDEKDDEKDNQKDNDRSNDEPSAPVEPPRRPTAVFTEWKQTMLNVETEISARHVWSLIQSPDIRKTFTEEQFAELVDIKDQKKHEMGWD